MKNHYIIVAFGGISPEHEVSVLTAMQAISALEKLGELVLPLYITKSGQWLTGPDLLDLKQYEHVDKLSELGEPCFFTHTDFGKTVFRVEKHSFFNRRADHEVKAVFTSFHGSAGENGAFQGLCELYNIPYTGTGVSGSAIGMDKVLSKVICKAHGIPVVPGVHFTENEWVKNEDSILKKAEDLGYPLIVKPVHLGSSIGVKRSKDRNECIRAIESAFRYDEHLLVEKAISPLFEINCAVLGTPDNNRASVCEKPLGLEEILSFDDKYQQGETGKGMASAEREIPADIPDSLTEKIQQTACNVFTHLHAEGVARLDFLVNTDTQEYYFNEINTIPGSFSFYLWEATDLSFDQLLQELLNLAIERHQRKNGRIQSYDTNLLSQKAVKGLKGLKGVK